MAGSPDSADESHESGGTAVRTDARDDGELRAGLRQRHVTMISIAGVIGAGLFIGSGEAIATAGPAVLISYLFAGTLVVLVMRMLGEMAAARPDPGSFSTYADRAIGPWAGFTVGWLYWWFWVLVIPVEATAAAVILNSWLPGVPQWGWALAVTVVLTVTNLFAVSNYGEFEFWFALLKVIAIIAFIVFGALAVLGLLPGAAGDVSGLSRLVSNGGFVPNGFGAVVAAVLITMFSFMGTEIVTIAAAESSDPARGIGRATRSVIWRIAVFYLASILLVVAIVPWQDPRLPESGSYQAALEVLGVPGAKAIVDVVVLVAVASCLNSALYTASRMLYSLGRRGQAPAVVNRTTGQGVPRFAVLGSTLIGFLAVIANYAFPEQVFSTLLATSGAVALLVYLVIAVSQLRMRRILEREGSEMPVRMWAYPVLTWAVIVAIPAVLVYMGTREGSRFDLAMTAIIAVAVVIVGVVLARRTRDRSPG
ncbi:gamma-aminobutyrate:proton symporter (AAT family) [Actinomycetospora succinea]|uniref:Gamma-aminobutyrate:proton symporter (AAT family) n=1 Tax=Actinomycetospora succinea TaxID=663603 RepID=A0A4R6VEH2_9PSEU|nr:GABA permease [Actinomycetospora succinea]TDQ58908.1 gamma-aminobutyrate:proton symporter (AAT family) [Actinomycetospora succinea]